VVTSVPYHLDSQEEAVGDGDGPAGQAESTKR